MRFSFCLLVSVLAEICLSKPTGVARASYHTSRPFHQSLRKRASQLQWFGVNEAGAEFGNGNLPGTLGKDYMWPNLTSIGVLMTTQKFNIFRIPFLMERMAQSSMTAALDATYFGALQDIVKYITEKNATAVLDAQNFGRYKGAVFNNAADFKTFWTNIATPFKNESRVVFDCNNEFHDEPVDTVAQMNQACIDGVRAAGATSQYVFVEGTSYTGAWTWTSSGNAKAMVNLNDPSNKIVYEMHQYLDQDGSGTHPECVSATIGVERIKDATAWLKSNKKKGILGEFAGGPSDVCKQAVQGMLDSLVTNNDVWMGAMAWAAGPWWHDVWSSWEPASTEYPKDGGQKTAYSQLYLKYV